MMPTPNQRASWIGVTSLALALALAALLTLPLTAQSATSKKKHQTVTITAVGDTMLGRSPELPSSPYTYLNAVKLDLKRKTDITFMNLEGTLTSRGASKCGGGSSDCFAFRTPKSYARVYKNAGFDVVNSANNHYNDFGGAGRADTDSALKTVGLVQTGKPGQIGYVKVGKLEVAFVGFAPYPWASDLLNLMSARSLINRAKANADLVVAYMHAGAEGAGKTHVPYGSEHAYGENRGNSRQFAHMAVNAGAALVIASGPHVLRGMEIYRNRLIAYSLGNFAGFHNFGSSGNSSLSAILRATVDSKGRLVAGRIFPVKMSGVGRPSKGGGSLRLIRSLSRSDFGKRGVRIHGDGSLVAP
jgi:poly-gamma-glutamate capsule biosynthesis protein CapA/YwtB (metallophosphatase superfamily)